MADKSGRAAFDAIIDDARDRIAELHVPGLAVGVIHGDSSYAAGIGVTNTSTQRPVTPDTAFYTCSITKTFTATLAMLLVEVGDLDLNDRIIDILPWFRVKDREATTRARVVDLFHHHTGWGGEHCFAPVPPGGSISEKTMLQAHFLEQILPFDHTWMYNNTNLAFAGHVLSVVGGKPYETLVEERILAPLGMDDSRFHYGATAPHDDFAWSHPPIYSDDDIGDLAPFFAPFPETAGSAGGLQSTVHDMLKYARFQLDGKDAAGKTLLSKDALAFAHAPAVDAPTGEFTGLTWFVRSYGDTLSPHHGGAWIGCRSWLQLIPDHDFAVIVFANSDRGVEAYTTVADAMVAAYTGLERKTPAAAGVDPSVLDRFVGVFKGTALDFEITTDGSTYQLAQTSSAAMSRLRGPGSKPPADPPPVAVANTSEGWLIVTEGPTKGALGELLEDASGEPNYLRIQNRICIRSTEQSG